MKAALLQAGLSLAISAASVSIYHHWFVRPSLRLGLVDVAEVYRLKEAEFTAIVTQSTSEGERERAMGLALVFAQRLPLALDELPGECGCLVMLKSAVAAPSPRAIDLTAHLKAKLDQP
ncbi:hypothetical protein [Piscinibacter sakaiensis]|uniref:hypothetical protein n=1 Tax=Piscinibacter sakaiensis TaxID=1547922 RepID=UPI003AAE04B2